MKQPSARATAAQALMRLLASDSYSNLVIESLMLKNRLDARDGAFASALFFGVLERKVTLEHILAHYSAKPIAKLTPQVYAAALIGYYQLCFMGGVEDHAAVNESVNLVKELGCQSASGFVNGILRSFLRDEKNIPPAKKTAADQLSVQYSCPVWLVRRLLDIYGEEITGQFLAASLGRPPVYLRANTTKTTVEGLVDALKQVDVACESVVSLDGCVLLHDTPDIKKLETFQKGLFHVQDYASQLCAQTVGAQPGERVLDVCAAPGGKSFTMAQHMGNRGELVARDLHEKRVALIRQGAERLGLSCISASCGDAAVQDVSLGKFDRILCDVPCSGFGVIRRKPEIKYKPAGSIQNLPNIQYKILENSSHYLEEGGTLVYSTCTLLPEENGDVVRRFLDKHPLFSMVSEKTYIGDECGDCDGFYVAVLVLLSGDTHAKN